MPSNSKAKKTPRVLYDCEKCPAFCCTVYERVAVTEKDLRRLAEHFQISEDEAARRYTKMWGEERVLRRKADALLGRTCRFLDPKTRGCTIYHARPEACRAYPERKRCAYYDLYRFELRHQDDATVLPLIRIEFKEWEKQPRLEGEEKKDEEKKDEKKTGEKETPKK